MSVKIPSQGHSDHAELSHKGLRLGIRPVKAPMGTWNFLSNHTHVLVCLTRDPEMRLREVAEKVRITERAVQRIVGELVSVGVLTKVKVGRRNLYQVHGDVPLQHALENHRTIGDILKLVV